VAEESQSAEEGIGGDSVATLPEDPIRQPVLDALEEHLGDNLVGHELANDDLWVRVKREAWRPAVEFCRDRLGMTYFCFLSGLDWMPNPDLLAEKEWEETDESDKSTVGPASTSTPQTGVAGGETRFQVFARLYSLASRVGVTLKADLPDGDLRIDSLVPLFRGADWHEREAWEMYGFQFVDHPGLRHLYLPMEFEGYPLRKDFPLLARVVKPWPGLVDVEPIPGEGVGDEEAAAGEGV
jgi:NADH-quinone oxidoreductase subunit C